MKTWRLNAFLKRWGWHIVTLIAFSALVIGLILMYYEYRFPSWTEKVALHDGRVIEVFQRRDVIDGYGTRQTWLTLDLPELKGRQTWDERLRPVIIEAEAGNVYVVGIPRGPKQYAAYQYPKYSYVAFIWDGNSFSRIPFMSIPEHLRRVENIRWCLPGGQDSREAASEFRTLGWCVDQKEDPFRKSTYSRSRTVDLGERAKEGLALARLDGHVPRSE